MKQERHPDLVALGQRIKALRSRANLTQQALAEACELDLSYLGGLEIGLRNPTYLTLRRLARGLRVPSRDLLPDEDAEPLLRE